MSVYTKDILETILEKLRSLASTETVVGHPVQVGEITILPVIKISVGFAAGGGEGTGDEGKGMKGIGTGGGGGATVNPVGFIVLDGKDVRFVAIGKGKIEALFDTVPELLHKLGIKKKEGGGKHGRKHGEDKSEEHETDEEA